ncbi:toxin-antitoxin system YwqK family antitoxin [Sphingobacterium sp. LRF_L2]|uniref:toxin-antitoxin system YwqK family antitoxin n=1 Tax=Sphingobacterium sp. LRF_L2 TaxID=3369421 RepID=UPI003F5E0F0F
MKLVNIFLVFIVISSSAWGQVDPSKRDTLFEKAPLDMVRFYYDNHYYLVDKDCGFKSIERLSQFIVSKNVFHGEFKDFDNKGTIILTGYYNQGVKEGNFKAYHPNGKLKWEVAFKENKPIGDWKYYYPDEKPMLTINYDEPTGRVIEFWDRLGRQRVIAGEGNYQFKMPFEFYNEYGFPFFERKGKIKNGLPAGYWTTNMVDDKEKKVLFTEEVYDKDGTLTEGYNLFLDAPYRIPLTIVPSNPFLLGEKLISKPCKFDDYSGFNAYLSDKFNAAFRANPSFQNMEDDFAYRVSLEKDGTPAIITLNHPLKITALNKYIEIIAKDIPFYFPSLNNQGEPIEDTLTISGKLNISEAGVFNFYNFKIEREEQR